jgi:hypothetical protein
MRRRIQLCCARLKPTRCFIAETRSPNVRGRNAGTLRRYRNASQTPLHSRHDGVGPPVDGQRRSRRIHSHVDRPSGGDTGPVHP